ncbi:MAG TPA: hypothetical protein P5133_16115, partial [Spirochaetia bacterium]|nr:hypothetical protein [Spirochaetia bacterium]
SGSDAHYPEHVGRRPFSVELPEELLAARLAARPGPEAERAGAELLAALAAALAARAIRPSWSLLPA